MLKMQFKRALALALLIIVTGFTTAAAATPADEETRAPELSAQCSQLQAPAGHEVAFHVYAVGVQVYVWRNGAWAFDGPVANLYADDNYRGLVGAHYRGPYWESNSGSRVKGQNAIPCVVDPNAIPWLRLEAATPTEGDGIFSRVTYIQRVNTTGGVKPADSGNFEGEVRKVPYTTEYYFYRASN